MARMEHAMEINAPVHVVYEQLLRYEEYPRFMENVQSVRKIDDRHLRWHARAGGRDVEWDVEIMQQVPGQSLAWRKTGEAAHEGRMVLEAVGSRRTRLRLSLDAGAAYGVEANAMLALRAEQDLVRFKKCIEALVLGPWPGQSLPRHAGPDADADAAAGGDVRPDAAAIASRRRRKAEGIGPRPELGLRPPWLPAFFPIWESPLQIVRRVSQEMDKIVDGVMAGTRLDGRTDAHRAAGSANNAYRNGGAWSPLVEVRRSGDNVVVLAELAGVRREDVQIDIRADRLMIEGDRHPQETQQSGATRRSERSYGHFYRVVDLPLGADPEAATASMHDGLLEIKVPVRPGAAECRRLDIKTSE